MKKAVIVCLLGCLGVLVSAQVPQGLNYQALAGDVSGNPIMNTDLQVRISILSDTFPLVIVWEELHSAIKTNFNGIFSLVVGSGLRQSSSSVPAFNELNWSAKPLYLKTQIYYQGSWKNMGSAKLWTVPYSMVAGDLGGSLNKLRVKGKTTSPDSALFEVKNNTGQTVFAVYNEGVRVYVDNGVAKGAKGGFAIGGFGTAKALSQEYFRVTSDSTRLYVKNAVKGAKGGFAIGGFSAVKGATSFYMNMTPANYFIGEGSGTKTTTGLYNSFIGYNAGLGNTTGSSNVFLGNESGKLNTDGNSNIFLGYQSGFSNTIGNANLFIGYQSGYYNISGNDNTFLGYGSGYSNTSGFGNLFIGRNSGRLNSTGSYNTFIGYNSGMNTNTGTDNTFVGYYAGYSNTVGTANIFVGRYAGESNVDGSDNLFLGAEAGFNNTSGYYNVFLGRQTGRSNTTGIWNMFLGNGAGWSNTTGSGNLFIGHSAGNNNNVGANNTQVGQGAGYSTTSGNSNTSVGDHSGYSNLTGSGNVFLGNYSGYSETGSNKLYISNSSTAIPLIGGNFSTGQVGINRMPTTYTLEVAGTIWANGATISAGASTWSDSRFKTNISTIPNALFNICNLRGVTYDWDYTNNNTQNFPKGRQIGVIAQEVEKIFPELVITGEDGYKSVSYEKMSAIFIEAFKDQQKQIELVKQENEKLKSDLAELKSLVNRLTGIRPGQGNK